MLNTFVQSIWSDLGLGQAAGWAKPVLSGVTVLLIVLLAFLSAALARRFIMASHKRLAARAEGPEERKRIETLERVNPDEITAKEALELLYALKAKLG